MHRIDLLNFSEFGKVRDLEILLSNNFIDSLSLSAAIFKCIEAKDLKKDFIDSIKLLLSYGAEINAKDSHDSTVLMHACVKGSQELVKLLLSYGANPLLLDRQKRTTIMLALMNAFSDPIEIIKLLQSSNVNIHAKDLRGQTALHYAAMNGHRKSLLHLISSDAEINVQDINRDTALHLAYKYNKRHCIEILMNVADPSIKNDKGKVPVEEENSKNSYPNRKNNHDEMWENRKKNKQKGKIYKRKEFDECSKCKQIKEVLCIDCANTFLQSVVKENENIERRIRIEIEERLKLANCKIKELEKENSKIKEALDVYNNNNPKIVKSALFLQKNNEKTYEQIIKQLQSDITSFSTDQQRWRQDINQTYNEAIRIFTEIIQESFSNCTVNIFGSFATDLLLPYSDIDIVITGLQIPPLVILKELIPKIDKLNIIRKSDKIFTAMIPLLKIYTYIRQQEVKIDITVAEPKHRGLDCTVLVKKFLATYKTIKFVFLVLKQLMFYTNFHEPYRGGISSYGLFLMLVYFYQENDLKIQKAENEKNEAEILIGFFEYYVWNFDYSKYIVVDYENWDNKELKLKVVKFI